MNYSKYSAISEKEIFDEFETSNSGLNQSEAQKRLDQYGANQLTPGKIGIGQIILRQFKSSFVYLLALAVLLSFLLGEKLDALMILLFVCINTGLGFFQEYRSEHTLRLLKKYLVSKTKVVRDGQEEIIEASNLVPGDVVILEPGDIVPADIRLVDSFGLAINESILTGESIVTAKSYQSLPKPAAEIYNASNICFLATIVAEGKGKGVVIATGRQTNYADIVHLATQTTKVSTFEKEMGKFSKFVLSLIIVTLTLVIILNLLTHKGSNPGQLAIFAIALAVSVIPEALPVVTTFSLSIGAMRLAKKKVVVKRLSAIEDLGSIQILCCDKTGTLTQNKLKITEVKSVSEVDTLLYANLASTYSKNSRNQGNNAFEETLNNALEEKKRIELKQFARVKEIPFDPMRKRASSAVERDGKYYLVVRGAPEDVLQITNADPSQKKKLHLWISQKGEEGIRVLAIAAKSIQKNEIEHLEKKESNLELLGFVAFQDPIKDTTIQAIGKAEKLGVQVKILSGDSKEVAGSVAYQIGLIDRPSEVITGAEFEALDFEKQRQAAHKYSVFARVTPQQKFKIIEILRQNYEVGFLGEGINDAPALKISNVALAVDTASDIARQASDIVLLEKSLSVIVDGIREGRAVFANTNKYIIATLSANFGNFFAISSVSLIIDFLPMLPLQILLVNLLSDFPMISVATDTVDHKDIETPRRYDLRGFAIIAILLGIVSTFFDFVFFATFFPFGQGVLQTSWFMGSILTELMFLFSVRSKKIFWKARAPSNTIIFLTLAAIVATILLPFTSFGQKVFGFHTPTISNLMVVLSIVVVYFITTDIVKVLYHRHLSIIKKTKVV